MMEALATIAAVPSQTSRQYPLQRQLRRAALWAVLGIGVLLGAIWARDIAGLKPPKAPPVSHVVPFFALFAAFISQYLLPRIRVDDAGIHRRILLWWDLWPWEDFTEGRVSHGTYIHGYRHRDKPFWAQRLELSALEPEVAKEIDGLIKRIWTPPALPECPEALTVTLKELGRPSLALTADGITFTRRERTVSCRWADLPWVRIWRLEADRADFRRLIFHLPDRQIRLGRPTHNGQQLQTWVGPSAEVVSRFVLAHARRVEDFAINGDAQTLDELEAKRELQLGGLKQKVLVMKRCCWFVAALCLAIPLACPWPQAVMMSLSLLIFIALYRNAANQLSMTRADLDRQRALLTV
ncbi:MAG TPA: hypothetical protein VM510_10205 [Caulifigura sp.]|nr:hypothetical protein [Caulifigura sp.]